MNICIKKVSLLIVIGYLSIQAQSVFSVIYPFGLPERPLSSTAVSMGGTSVGIPDEHNVMLANPANLGIIDKTAFSSLILIDYLRLKDHNYYTDHIAISPSQVSFAIPFGKIGNVAFSFSKEYNALLKFERDSVVSFGGIPVNAIIQNDYTGGMNSWKLGWGRPIKKWANIGAAYERVYLTINQTHIQNFAGAVALAVSDSTYTTFMGNGIHLGFMGVFEKFSFGISGRYVLKGEMKQYNQLYNGAIGAGNFQKVSEGNKMYDLQLPPVLSAGIGYEFSSRWLAGSDLTMTLWKASQLSGNVLPGFNYENIFSACAGVQFIPAPNLLIPKYWEKMHYRCGARYTQLPDHKSYEAAFSLGTGLPLRANGLLDIGFEVGTRRATAFKDISETFVKASIGINGGRKLRKSSIFTY